MESQAYGTPVAAADIGGTPELVENNRTGELFQSKNKDDLKKTIRKLWDNPELCRTYHENCREVKFDTPEEYCEKLLKLYQAE